MKYFKVVCNSNNFPYNEVGHVVHVKAENSAEAGNKAVNYFNKVNAERHARGGVPEKIRNNPKFSMTPKFYVSTIQEVSEEATGGWLVLDSAGPVESLGIGPLGIKKVKDTSDSAEVTDGKIVGGEGRSWDGIPYGLYQEGGRSYRGFEITSSENGLRKGVYRFYNWGGGVPFGNSAVDGQFTEAQFQKLIGEGKVKLLDSVGYFGDAGDFAVAMSESSSQYDGRHRFLGNGGRSWVQGGSDNVDLFNTREEAEKRAKEQLPRYKASVVSAEVAKKPWVRDSKMFKVTDKKSGKARLVRAEDSLAAVKRVSSLKDSNQDI